MSWQYYKCHQKQLLYNFIVTQEDANIMRPKKIAAAQIVACIDIDNLLYKIIIFENME